MAPLFTDGLEVNGEMKPHKSRQIVHLDLLQSGLINAVNLAMPYKYLMKQIAFGLSKGLVPC